jgi:hypothetical protein
VTTARLFTIADVLDSDAWYTPPWIFDGLGLTFDLDVAAPDGGVPWIPATRSYSVADDGLLQPWDGLVWCNPPYSAAGPWCVRWANHPHGCLLIRSDLSTSGPYTAFGAASSVYVPAKRIHYVNGQGGPVVVGGRSDAGATNFSSVLFGRGAHVDAALTRLAQRCGGTTRILNHESGNPE